MATVYKRTQRKPIPAGAEIVRRKGRQYAVWIHGDRRRRAPLTADGLGIILESAGYVIQYFDHNGKRRKKEEIGTLRRPGYRPADGRRLGAQGRPAA